MVDYSAAGWESIPIVLESETAKIDQVYNEFSALLKDSLSADEIAILWNVAIEELQSGREVFADGPIRRLLDIVKRAATNAGLAIKDFAQRVVNAGQRAIRKISGAERRDKEKRERDMIDALSRLAAAEASLGFKIRQWQERQHPRGPDGRFIPKR